MNVTEVAAWVGAIAGPTALLWDFFKWKTGPKPKLTMTAYANMVQMPSLPYNPRFLRIVVQNVGATTTTLTNAGFNLYGSRWAKFRVRPFVVKIMYWTLLGKVFKIPKFKAAVLNRYQGPQLPQKLEVGGEWAVLMQQDRDFDTWLDGKELYCAVWHSFSQTPKQARIFRSPK